MHRGLNKPKRFGEILDITFQLSKEYFASFMKVFLILMLPLFLIEALIFYFSGVGFFREMSGSGSWFEQILASFEETDPIATTSLMGDIGLIISGLLTLLIFPIASAAILIAINHVRKGEEFTVGNVIKGGFSRFWPILGSNILFALILIGLFIGMIIAIAITSFIGAGSIVLGVILTILAVGGSLLASGLWTTRFLYCAYDLIYAYFVSGDLF